jgi:hypothetical protein
MTQTIKPVKYLFQITVAIFAIFLLSSCVRFQPIQNVPTQSIPPNLSLDQITKVIKTECEQRDWHVEEERSGLIIANHLKEERFSATVEIKYSTKGYSIKYLKSKNLLDSQGNIHRNYNKWVILLDRDIRVSLNRLGAKLSNKK